MSKNQSQYAVPKLRFPEFRQSDPWKTQPLGKYLDYLQPTSFLVSNTQYSDEYETPVLTAGKTFILGYTNEKEGVFDRGLPVIIFDDFTTASQLVDFPFKAKSSAMKILQPKNGANIKFMYEAMQSIEYEVGVHTRHWISKFAPMRIPIPQNSKEQQKIADCLSSIDELINSEKQKLAELEAHKKGLMQNLFPKIGRSLPRYRFPEFQELPEWQSIKIGDPNFGSLHKGKGISKSDIDPNGSVSCIRYGELYTQYTEVIDTVISKTNAPTESLFMSKENDVIIPASGETQVDIATASCVLRGGIALGGDLNVIRSKNNGAFISYYLNGILKSEIAKIAQGISVVHLYPKQLEKLELHLPDQLEQQKIADCISSLDNLIKSKLQNIEELQQFKLGLLQKLFPSIDEVVG